MKTLLVASILFIGGAAPALADDPNPIACAVDSDGNEYCSTEEPIVVGSTEEPMPIDAPIDVPDCSVDMSACERGVIMYNKQADIPSVSHNDTHKHETWWDIFTDPSHIGAELAWSILENVIIIGLLYNFIFKRFLLPKLTRRIHEDIDKEHGVQH